MRIEPCRLFSPWLTGAGNRSSSISVLPSKFGLPRPKVIYRKEYTQKLLEFLAVLIIGFPNKREFDEHYQE